MCCKFFGKGIVVFSTAFLFGLLTVNLSLPFAEIPNVEPVKFELKKCESDNEVFNKYKNYSVGSLEKEFVENLGKSSENDERIVIRKEMTQDLTIEETKILRRKMREEFPRDETQKLYVLMMLIKYKKGEIKKHPFYKGDCVEN